MAALAAVTFNRPGRAVDGEESAVGTGLNPTPGVVADVGEYFSHLTMTSAGSRPPSDGENGFHALNEGKPIKR